VRGALPRGLWDVKRRSLPRQGCGLGGAGRFRRFVRSQGRSESCLARAWTFRESRAGTPGGCSLCEYSPDSAPARLVAHSSE